MTDNAAMVEHEAADRKEFEEWYRNTYPYANSYTQSKLLYEGWQGAKASERGKTKDDCATVEQIEALTDLVKRINARLAEPQEFSSGGEGFGNPD